MHIRVVSVCEGEKCRGNGNTPEDKKGGQLSAGGDVLPWVPVHGGGMAAARRVGWLVLGVDPGEQGAVALIRCWPGQTWPQLEELEDASDRKAVRQLVALARLVVVEGQQASPQMGTVSAFRLGCAFGAVLEAVEAGAAKGGIQVAVTFPTAWRGSYGLGGGKSGKEDGMAMANRLLKGRGSMLSRHDQADAVLLAWWGWRKRLLARAVQELQAAPGG